MQEPGKIKTPSTVFVCSMADLFGHLIPDEWIFEVFKACAEHPQHRYMFLTKIESIFLYVKHMNLFARPVLPKVRAFPFSGLSGAIRAYAAITAFSKACAEHPQHRYMFLTKNPMRYFSLMDSGNLPKSENMRYRYRLYVFRLSIPALL